MKSVICFMLKIEKLDFILFYFLFLDFILNRHVLMCHVHNLEKIYLCCMVYIM